MTTAPSQTDRLTELGKDTRLIPQESTNFEMPLVLADSFITPTDRFFIRSNGPTLATEIDPATWRLHIHGCVENEISLSLAELRSIGERTFTAFLECSGNSRTRFVGQGESVEGTAWGEGAIGNATWIGVPLSAVLAKSGMRADAVEVVAQGGDFETMQRSLPLDTATNGDVILAWAMNGAPLLPVHGGPIRLIVPGWGAIASTKWITSLELIDHTFDGYWNADNYVLYDESGAAVGPVTQMPVKSVITSPASESQITPGTITVIGFAWSGHAGIASIDISLDGGKIWHPARIVEQAGPFAWVQFAFEWNATSGVHRLASRATDQAGNVQPEIARWNRKGYQMNAIRWTSIEVVPA